MKQEKEKEKNQILKSIFDWHTLTQKQLTPFRPSAVLYIISNPRLALLEPPQPLGFGILSTVWKKRENRKKEEREEEVWERSRRPNASDWALFIIIATTIHHGHSQQWRPRAVFVFVVGANLDNGGLCW